MSSDTALSFPRLLTDVQGGKAAALPTVAQMSLAALRKTFEGEKWHFQPRVDENYTCPFTFPAWLVTVAKPAPSVLYAYARRSELQWRDVLVASCSSSATEELMRMYPHSFWEKVAPTYELLEHMCEPHVLLDSNDRLSVVTTLLADPRFPIYNRSSEDVVTGKPLLHLLLSRVALNLIEARIFLTGPDEQQPLCLVRAYRNVVKAIVNRNDFDAFARDGRFGKHGITAAEAFATRSSDEKEASDELWDFVRDR